MEIWRLGHPEAGLLEVERGYDAEFAERGEWPKEPKEFTPVLGDAPFIRRIQLWRKNPAPRMQIVVNGEVRSRHDKPRGGRYSLQKKLESDLSFSENSAPPTKPYVDIQATPFGEIQDVYYRDGEEAVAFDPPAGSLGEKRRKAMEESPFKRVLYPLLGGLGKSGWAIAMIVLAPIISRILSRLLPDVDFPEIYLPLPNLPNLPEPPQITLPAPQFAVHFEAPEWVVFLMDYSRVWMPIVIAIAFGVMAVRNAKKSEAKKKEWQNHEDSRRD
ncbi:MULTISPECIES: hypothetical protein [unclassified Corynebacterium]|uniref:hypothetical protein n=1 Tax=unclassified Corynebacterium TaxID=2624378 RepID=UPI0003B91B4C|nr:MULTISPECIES: hypothetical protein [unclassified Corynebacterium]ERS52228.1 hypothetical protein HMPREF1281_01448 [Corynebacterium sp. KPL1855]ERS63204.1 hypothetical protein HMPREF1257_01398 [Corynebacterium sp. KPL1814]ERS78792.1 hypothetical protein HMPREF1285_01288 [Corynebacterium sp. KPL1859]